MLSWAKEVMCWDGAGIRAEQFKHSMEILGRLPAGHETRQRLSRVAGVGLRKSGTPTKAESKFDAIVYKWE